VYTSIIKAYIIRLYSRYDIVMGTGASFKLLKGLFAHMSLRDSWLFEVYCLIEIECPLRLFSLLRLGLIDLK